MDAEATVKLGECHIQLLHILLGQIAAQQRKIDVQLADFVREQRAVALLLAFLLLPGTQALLTDLHKVDAIRRGRCKLDVQPADRLAGRAVFIALVRRDQADLLTLLPVPHGN